MILVALSYAEIATMYPVSGGEVAYCYEVYGVGTSFVAGWFLALAYIAFTAFEAISAGWIIATLLPQVEGAVLYVIWGTPVKVGSLLIGLVGVAAISLVNIRGIKGATTFQEILTYSKIVLSVMFIAGGVILGHASNLVPLFRDSAHGGALKGILAVFVTAPVWFAGFNVIPQLMEERSPNIAWRTIGRIFGLSIAAAAVFYCLLILSASMSAPWQSLLDRELPAAAAFESAFKSRVLANTVLVAALLGVFTTWNGVFIAGSRVLFSLGRAKIIAPELASIHKSYGTPAVAILVVGVLASVGVLLGRSAIEPIVNVGTTCFGLVFFLTCIAVIKLRISRPEQPRPYRVPGGLLTASLAAFVSLFVICVSVYEPYRQAQGKVSIEATLFLLWGLLAIPVWFLARRIRGSLSEAERRKCVLGVSGLTNQEAAQ